MERENCVARDAQDPLASVRERFDLPAGVYLAGHSLGPAAAAVATRTAAAVRQWQQRGVRGWSEGWLDLAPRCASRLARLVGADVGEVAVADSTSVNLFKVLGAAVCLRPGRHVILTETGNFPTDRYVAEGLARLAANGTGSAPLEVRAVPADRLADSLDGDVAVLALTHVDYQTGRRHGAEALTDAAHAAGALVVWDLAHSTGAVPVDLHAWDADLAVGCSYKYLGGGPGAPAYLFAARALHADLDNPVAGWFGHADPFAFDAAYRPAADAGRFATGTPPLLSLAALDAALEVWDGLDLAQVWDKVAALGELFVSLVDERCADLDVAVASPRSPAQRGAQVSLRAPHAGAVMQALADRGVIGDSRPPDVLRFGLTPLTTCYADVWDAVEQLRSVLAELAWDDPRYRRPPPVP